MKTKLYLFLIFVANIYFVITSFSQIPTNGLMGYYPFSGNANDLSGNSQNGTVNGATLTTDRFGNVNSAYNFNGISNYISLLPSTNYIGLNKYTYSLWIKPTAIPTNGGGIIYGVGEATGNGIEQALTYQPATSLYAGGHNIGTNPFQSSSQSSPMATNQWIHVVVTRDSVNVKMFVNQNLIALTPNSATNNQQANYGSGTKNAIIGGRCNLNSAYFFTGVIDDIRIYDRTVSQIEVNALYNESLNGLSIASPLNSVNINNRCDFKFCIQDSLGQVGTNSPVYITNSNILGGGTFQTTPYNIGTPGIPSNFCLTNTSFAFTSGIHNFYLWHSTSGTFEVVDSVILNIVNPINDLCSSLSFSRTPVTNVDYMFSVNGLDPAETYTLRLHSFNGPATDSIVVSGVTTGNLTQHYAHNGIFYPILSITSACENYCDDSTGNSVNITNGCASYSSLTQAGFQNAAICLNDSTSFSGALNYTNLPGNDTSSIIINWGDGISETNLFPTDTNGVDTIIRHHLYTSPGVYTALLKFYNDSACYNDSVITTINVNVCGNLKGNVYNDLNNNCSQNTGELGMDRICLQVKQGSNTYLAWTDSLGNYEFTTLPVGSYIIQINNLNLGYTITCGNSLTHAINVTTGITIANFATYCNGLDIAVTGISLLNSFVPGQTSAILPYVGIFNNTCNTALPGQVKIILSPCLTYTTICPWGNTHPTPSHVLQANTGDTLVWNVSDINNLGTFGYFDYFAHVTTCTTAQVGDTACVTIIVLPTTGDADTSNNIFTECFEIGVSFDPNNKEVIPKGNGVNGDIPINTPDLTYTINFQNTGTATAYNIYLLDTISANLDISSIEIISSSHQMVPYLLSDSTMKFMFANIMLADSTHDEEHSHGYVTYRIKLNSGLTAGMQIKNTAYIYFDYNSPVVTNTTINTIETLTGIQDMNIDRLFKVYPNPANDKLIVRVDKNGSNCIVITDVLGKKVKQIKTTELKTEINISDLQSGIYFISLTQENMNSVQKVIISK